MPSWVGMQVNKKDKILFNRSSVTRATDKCAPYGACSQPHAHNRMPPFSLSSWRASASPPACDWPPPTVTSRNHVGAPNVARRATTVSLAVATDAHAKQICKGPPKPGNPLPRPANPQMAPSLGAWREFLLHAKCRMSPGSLQSSPCAYIATSAKRVGQEAYAQLRATCAMHLA